MHLMSHAVHWDSALYQICRQVVDARTLGRDSRVEVVIEQLCIWNYLSSDLKRAINEIFARNVEPWAAAHAVALAFIDRLIHHIPGVYIAAEVRTYSANM